MLLLAIFVLCQELEREFVDLLVVDTFSAPKTWVPTPKVKIERLITTPRQQISKTPQICPPESQPVTLAEPLRRTALVDVNQPRRLLDTAQITQTTVADLSTIVRALRMDTTVLPQAEVDTPSGTDEHGLNAFGTPGYNGRISAPSLNHWK